jgi:MarR family transcriptional regulator, organic hydroperoxide resistance regulator
VDVPRQPGNAPEDAGGQRPVSRAVTEVVRLADEIGDHAVRRRLGTLLSTPLTAQQLRLLAVLVVHGSATPHQLSGQLEVSPATITGLADRLVGAGMAERVTGTADARSRPLAPTPAGRAVVRRLLAADMAADLAVLADLTPEELAGLRLGLAGVLRSLRRAAGDDS